jgi:hypothetical protein
MFKYVYGGDPNGPPAREKQDVKNIVADFKKWGFARVKLLSLRQQQDLILENFGKIVQKQPWADTIKLYGADGSELDYRNPAHRQELLAILANPLSVKMRKYFEARWTMHAQFGACCDPNAFNLDIAWEIREDPFVYEILCELFGKSVADKCVATTHERAIQKLPGKGQKALAHFDLDLKELHEQMDQGEFELCIIQGKVTGLSGSTFKCLPGSQTRAFHEEMREKYKQHYPMNKRSDKFGLRKDLPDPMNLLTSMVEFTIGPGEWLLFDSRLLHGHGTLGLQEPISFGLYMGGFLLSAKRAAKYLKKAGITEERDHLESWKCGEQVTLWPSFDTVHPEPMKFSNFPRVRQPFLDKLKPFPVSPHPYTEAYPSSDGTIRYKIKPPLDPAYVPPVLTPHGIDMLLCHSQDKDLRAEAEAVNAAAAARRAAVQSAAPAAGGAAAGGAAAGSAAAGGASSSKRKIDEVIVISSDEEEA